MLANDWHFRIVAPYTRDYFLLLKPKPYMQLGQPGQQKKQQNQSMNNYTTTMSGTGSMLDLLTDDAVSFLGRWVGAAGLADLVHLQQTCRRTHRLLATTAIGHDDNDSSGSPLLLQELVRDRHVPVHHAGRIASVEQLALWEAVQEAGLEREHRISFAMASIEIAGDDPSDSDAMEAANEHDIRGSRQRLLAVARILQQFPRATVVVEAHTGTAAPRSIAQEFSRHRGDGVLETLVNHCTPISNNGIGDDYFQRPRPYRRRIELRAWGMRIAQAAASAAQHPHSPLARQGKGWCEIYVRHEEDDGWELPMRPSFYEGRVFGS